MASPRVGTSRVVTAMAAFLLVTAVISVESIKVAVFNEFVTVGKQLDVHCRNNDGKDFGTQTLSPFTQVSWSFTAAFLGRDVMTCTFSAHDKPDTTIDVYKGWAFSGSPPCNCRTTGTCEWLALNEGFWCNHEFVQNWG